MALTLRFLPKIAAYPIRALRSIRHSIWQRPAAGSSLSLPIGRIQERYAWDVQVIDTSIPSAKLPIFDEHEDVHDIFQKIMYLARPEHIREVWVQGDKVHSR